MLEYTKRQEKVIMADIQQMPILYTALHLFCKKNQARMLVRNIGSVSKQKCSIFMSLLFCKAESKLLNSLRVYLKSKTVASTLQIKVAMDWHICDISLVGRYSIDG